MRIGVSIPNDLHRRMAPLKPALNVSQVCREAIEAYVEEYERAAVRMEADGLEQAVDRLCSADDQAGPDWEELGWTDAKSWVENVDLETFEHLLHRLAVLKKQGRPSWKVPPPHVPGVEDFYGRQGEHREWFIKQFELLDERGEEGDPYADAEQQYMRAWVTYTMAVWGKIQQRREAQAKERLEQLRERRSRRPQPEVPDHLR